MTMGEKPRLAELLLGTEGQALLRLAFTGDEAMRDARVTEMRDLLEHLDDPELAAALAAPNTILDVAMRCGRKPATRPCVCSPSNSPPCRRCLRRWTPARPSGLSLHKQ